MTSAAERAAGAGRPGRVSLDELARQRGVEPVASVREMAEDGIFDSDEDLEAFLSHVHAARIADVG